MLLFWYLCVTFRVCFYEFTSLCWQCLLKPFSYFPSSSLFDFLQSQSLPSNWLHEKSAKMYSSVHVTSAFLNNLIFGVATATESRNKLFEKAFIFSPKKETKTMLKPWARLKESTDVNFINLKKGDLMTQSL